MQSKFRRHWLQAALVGTALAFAGSAMAQNYPSKPIRLVVPFTPGGVTDTSGRLIAEQLSKRLGQQVVVDNKPGASGNIGTQQVATAEPDGYTLLLGFDGTMVINPHVFPKTGFDTLKDFAPISTLGTFDIAIIVPANSRFKTLGEVLAFARTNPGKLNVGSINVGSTQNLAAELFKTAAGIDAQIVPFNGTPAVVTALRGGQVEVAVEILGPVMSQISAQALRALAVTGDKRAAVLPEVPTAKEAGVANLSASSWNGLAAPAKTPAAVIARLNKEITAALNAPDVKKKLADLNVDAQASSPEQTAALLASDIRRWGEVITRAKIPQQ
jgi:tripartite-type tricarboxylate transporter receptor subunit TctC